MSAPFGRSIKYKVWSIKGFILFLAFTLYLILYTLYPSPAFAQNATPSATIPLPSYISQTSPAYTDLMIFNMFHTFSCLAVGGSIIGQPCVTYQLQKNAEGLVQSVPVLSKTNLSGGALGVTTSILIGMYQTPPSKVTDYLAIVGQDLGIIKEAKAQVGGSGNAILSPVIKLWQVSRNITYLVMILIFVTIGIMVMFRQRINPQTVITAQAALPGLVIGLILITFSYFIASLATDMAFVGTDLVGYYFQSAQTDPEINDPQPLTKELRDKSVLTLLSPFAGAIQRGDIGQALDDVWRQIRSTDSFDFTEVKNHVGNTAETIIRGFTGFAAYQFGAAVGPMLGSAVAGIGCFFLPTSVPGVGPFIGPILGTAGFALCSAAGGAIGSYVIPPAFGLIGFLNPPFILQFVVAFAAIFIILYSMGKLLLRLINCYLTIVFLTITGPFHIIVSTLPGRQEIAIDWIRNILCNALSFPAVAAVIYFAGYLLGDQNSHLSPIIQSQLAITTTYKLPLFGSMDLSFLRILLAFAALVALPSIPDIICKSIGKPGAAGDLFSRELQGNIQSGRGYQNQFGEKVGAVGTDLSQFRKKWYDDPYEKKGFGARMEEVAGGGGKPRPQIRKTFAQVGSRLFKGKSTQEANRPENIYDKSTGYDDSTESWPTDDPNNRQE